MQRAAPGLPRGYKLGGSDQIRGEMFPEVMAELRTRSSSMCLSNQPGAV